MGESRRCAGRTGRRARVNDASHEEVKGVPGRESGRPFGTLTAAVEDGGDFKGLPGEGALHEAAATTVTMTATSLLPRRPLRLDGQSRRTRRPGLHDGETADRAAIGGEVSRPRFQGNRLSVPSGKAGGSAVAGLDLVPGAARRRNQPRLVRAPRGASIASSKRARSALRALRPSLRTQLRPVAPNVPMVSSAKTNKRRLRRRGGAFLPDK
jgi:hypothetical protein